MHHGCTYDLSSLFTRMVCKLNNTLTKCLLQFLFHSAFRWPICSDRKRIQHMHQWNRSVQICLRSPLNLGRRILRSQVKKHVPHAFKHLIPPGHSWTSQRFSFQPAQTDPPTLRNSASWCSQLYPSHASLQVCRRKCSNRYLQSYLTMNNFRHRLCFLKDSEIAPGMLFLDVSELL